MPLDFNERERIRRIEADIAQIQRDMSRLLQTVREWHREWKHLHQTVRIVLTLDGEDMSSGPVGSTATASIAFEDASGDPTSAPAGNGSGPILVTFSSDNEAVDTVDPSSGLVTRLALGSANISANVTNGDGSPLLEDDGVTPFNQPAPVADDVTAGPANQIVLTVT